VTSGDCRCGDHADASVPQVADRPAIRGLLEFYAHCAAQTSATGQGALFTDTDFLVATDSPSPLANQPTSGAACFRADPLSRLVVNDDGRW
jgi:hypothetical protein